MPDPGIAGFLLKLLGGKLAGEITKGRDRKRLGAALDALVQAQADNALLSNIREEAVKAYRDRDRYQAEVFRLRIENEALRQEIADLKRNRQG